MYIETLTAIEIFATWGAVFEVCWGDRDTGGGQRLADNLLHGEAVRVCRRYERVDRARAYPEIERGRSVIRDQPCGR